MLYAGGCLHRADHRGVPIHPGVKWAGTRRYGVPADDIRVPADSASEIVKFTISIPRESCTNAKAKYSSSVVPPNASVDFYHCVYPHYCK